jgi:hypothetical protein
MSALGQGQRHTDFDHQQAGHPAFLKLKSPLELCG